MNRNETIKLLGFETLGVVKTETSPEENFQNTTLRPILKFQNSLILLAFAKYCLQYKNVFYNLSLEKKEQYISNAINKDLKFRHFLRGLIVGLFNETELNFYFQNQSNSNKRINQLLVERLKSQQQIL